MLAKKERIIRTVRQRLRDLKKCRTNTDKKNVSSLIEFIPVPLLISVCGLQAGGSSLPPVVLPQRGRPENYPPRMCFPKHIRGTVLKKRSFLFFYVGYLKEERHGAYRIPRRLQISRVERHRISKQEKLLKQTDPNHEQRNRWKEFRRKPLMDIGRSGLSISPECVPGKIKLQESLFMSTRKN